MAPPKCSLSLKSLFLLTLFDSASTDMLSKPGRLLWLCGSSLSAWCCGGAKGIWKHWSSHNATTLLLASSITTWKWRLKNTNQRTSLIEQARAACWAGIQSQGFCFSGYSDSPPQSFLWAPMWVPTCSWWYWSVCLWQSLLISTSEFLKVKLLSPAGWNFGMETSCWTRLALSPGMQF